MKNTELLNEKFFVSHPTVVIGIPVFNEALHVRATLESVTNQTWKDFKVVIADNCSTDNTGAICKEYCQIDDRFTYICQPKNLGAVVNFQYLFDCTESRYFMWLGAHDLIHPDFLITHLSTMENSPNIVLSYSFTQWIDEYNNLGRISNGGKLADIKGKPWFRYLNSIECLGEYTCINQLIRRSALSQLIIEPVYACDQIILSRIIYHGLAHRDPQPLYIAREFIHDRPQTEMERVTGRKNTGVDLNLYKSAYLRDFARLFRGHPMKNILRLFLLFCLEKRILMHKFKYQYIPIFLGFYDRLIKKIDAIIKGIF